MGGLMVYCKLCSFLPDVDEEIHISNYSQCDKYFPDFLPEFFHDMME